LRAHGWLEEGGWLATAATTMARAGELVVGDGRVGILVGFSLRETPGLDVARGQ